MRIRRYFIIMIILSILVSIPLIARKVKTENSNKKVDFILDYYQVEELAEQSEKPIEWWLKEFKKMGINSAGINYETIESMLKNNRKIQSEIISNIIEKPNWRTDYPYEVVKYIDNDKTDKYDVIIKFEDYGDYEFAAKGLKEKYEKKILLFPGTNSSYIIIDTKLKDGLYSLNDVLVDNEGKATIKGKKLESSSGVLLPIGIDSEKIKIIEAAGIKPTIRISNPINGWFSDKYMQSVIEDFESEENVSPYIIFGGEEVLGYPKKLDNTINFLKKNNLSVGIVETVVERSYIEQKGLDKLLEKLGYQVNKVYSVPDYIQKRYKYMNYKGGEEIGNVLFRAITERNANLIYFRPFINENGLYVEKLSDYQDMFKELSNRLEKHEITIGETQPYNNNNVRKIAVAVLSLGIVSAGVLTISSLFRIKERMQIVLFIIGVLGSLGVIATLGRTGYMIMTLLAAIVFPSLGITYYNSLLKRIYLYDRNISYKDSLLKGIKAFVFSALITATGSLIVAAIMSSTRNILDIDYFVGVKISQLIPFVVFGISFLGLYGYKRDKRRGEDYFAIEDFNSVMQDSTKIFYFVLLGAVGFLGYIYLARTGHETGVMPSNAELIFRNMLERGLYARPRTKEFLIAFPVLIVGVAFAKYRIKAAIFASGLIGVIGLTSIVNTFTHFKTPFMISIARLFYSAVFGIVIGAVYLAVIYFIYSIYNKLLGRNYR